MFRKVVFFDNLTSAFSSTWGGFLLQWIFFLLLGFAIVIVPELLAMMVAATFVLVGATCLFLAWKTYRFRRQYRIWRDEFWEPLE